MTKKQPYPTGKLMALMVKLDVNEPQALKIGQHIVIEAQELFEKWKNNFQNFSKKEVVVN